MLYLISKEKKMTSYYLSKQQSQPFISENNSSNRLQKFNLIMSNEETKQLAGLVAKTRALFENSNRSSDQSSKPHMTQKVFINNRFQKQIPPLASSSSENDSDKENSSSNKETIAPFLNQLKPTSKLASKFNQIFNNISSNNKITSTNSASSTNQIKNIWSNSDNNKSEQTKLVLPNITSPAKQLKNRWQMTEQYQPSSPPLYSSSSSSTASSSSSPPPSSLSCHSFECNANELIINSGQLSQSSSPSSTLWQASEETSKELNLPTSVRQAKLCFERSIQQQSTLTRTTPTPNHQLTKPVKTIHTEFSSSSTSTSSSVPSSPTSSVDNDFKSLLNQKPKDEEKTHNIFINNSRKQTLQPALNSNNLPHLLPSSSNKIKILKKNFSNKSLSAKNEQQPKEDHKYVQQSPRFLHLFQTPDCSAMPVKVVTEDSSSIKEQTISLPASNATSTASIQIKTIKLKQQEPVVSIKSILRNKAPNMTENVKSATSPKLNEKYVNAFLEKTNESAPTNPIKVDQSSCVLPSKMKSKNKTALSDERQYPLQKSTQNNNIHFKAWQNKAVQDASCSLPKNINNSSNNCFNSNNNLPKR